MNSLRTHRLFVRALAASVALAGVAGCGLDRPAAPDLAGPSSFALNLTLTATPDTLVQDGESTASIVATIQDADGLPVANRQVLFSASSNSALIRSVSFTATSVGTDANGRAVTQLIAPLPPATLPAQPPIITVSAIPVGASFGDQASRSVLIRLMAPEGTPLTNQDPVAVIVANPRVANFNETIRFDASLSTDEGQACNGRCTYIWEFGDNTVAVKGLTADHAYPLPGDYVVTLTVTDDRGGVGTATVTIRVIGPTAPVANFTVIPTPLPVNTQGTFDATTSTVGAGASITQYSWNFGDGSPLVVTSSATTNKTYATTGTKTVTLTVTDSLGRTATRTSAVTVQ